MKSICLSIFGFLALSPIMFLWIMPEAPDPPIRSLTAQTLEATNNVVMTFPGLRTPESMGLSITTEWLPKSLNAGMLIHTVTEPAFTNHFVQIGLRSDGVLVWRTPTSP